MLTLINVCDAYVVRRNNGKCQQSRTKLNGGKEKPK